MAKIAKKPTWVVAPGKSMKIRDKATGKARIVHENTVLKGELSDDECAKHEACGFLVRKGYEDEAQVEAAPQITHEGELAEAPPPPPRAAASIWNVDPKKLKGKSLEGLNVMIAERDTQHPPAASIPEAIKILSSDFQG